ncbi:hypothetical protein QO200_17290 [Flavobacterium sp. Arc3]|uniref:hypothetical protein n=1 Tax=Flavobacterium sp. Arc3 TaxID=3046686 RepID=UPI00352F5A8F
MEKIWIIALSLFLIITFVFWRGTSAHFKKEYGKKSWELWGTRTFYWQGALLISGSITILLLFVFKWANVLSF